RGQALVGLLRIMHAVIAMPARHQRRGHHLRADAERLAPEIFGELCSLFDDYTPQLVAPGERPPPRVRPVTLEDGKGGAAHPASADLNQRGVLGDLRPGHRPDDRLGARTREGGDADGAVAHGIVLSSQILSGSLPEITRSRQLVVNRDLTHVLLHASHHAMLQNVRAVLAAGWR